MSMSPVLTYLFLDDVVVSVWVGLCGFMYMYFIPGPTDIGDAPEDAVARVVVRADDGILLRAEAPLHAPAPFVRVHTRPLLRTHARVRRDEAREVG